MSTALTQGAAIAAGSVYAELPEHVAEVVDPNQGETTSMANEPVGMGDCLFTVGQMRDFADRTHALRIASHGQAPAQPARTWCDGCSPENCAGCRRVPVKEQS